eukprot:1979_1
MEVHVFDTAGQARWQAACRPYYKRADCIFVCFAIDDEDAFENIWLWRQAIEEYAPDDVIVMLVGCKADLIPTNRECYQMNRKTAVNMVKVNKWKQFNTKYFECSSKTGSGVETLFLSAVQAVMERRNPRLETKDISSHITARIIQNLRDENAALIQRMTDCEANLQRQIASLKQDNGDRLKNVQNQMTSLTRKHEGIRAKLTQEKKALQHENDTLKRDNNRMATRLQEFAMNQIKTCDARQEVVMQKETMEKQKQFDVKLQMDENRLREWNLNSIKIENELKCEEKEDVIQTTKHLLDRYMECKTLCETQQIRMENVVTYCTKLNKMKKALKRENKQEQCNELEEQYQNLNTKHDTLRKKRIALQRQWINICKEMNEIIDLENETNALTCSALDQYNICNLESKHWDALYAKSVELIKKYRLFDAENEENMDRMKQMFDGLWKQCLECWSTWQAEDIICWIKYLKVQKQLILSNEFDFDYVLNGMIKSKMNGLSLKSIGKSDLKTVGVMKLDDR